MRARTGLGIGLAVLGVLSLAAAAILVWVVVPNRKELPADTNTVRQYSGTAKVLLNPQALAGGDLRNALRTNVPVTAERTVKVLATDGNVAQVSDERVLLGGGQPIGQTSAKYAVDRKTMEAATTGFPSDWSVDPAQGLTVTFPIGSEKIDYTGWVSDTQTTTPITYEREETKGGVNAYVYTSTVAAAPIKDQDVLANLPPALPQTVLGGLAAVLPLTDQQKAGLAQALPLLANPVPLSYTYEATSTFWVEPTTGIVVDVDREEIRKAGIGGPGGAVLAAIPIYDVTTRYTDQSVTAAANEAKDKKDDLTLYGTTLPWILAGLGALLLVVGVVLALTGRRRGPTQITAGAGTTQRMPPQPGQPPQQPLPPDFPGGRDPQ
jgi:Porin PorA